MHQYNCQADTISKALYFSHDTFILAVPVIIRKKKNRIAPKKCVKKAIMPCILNVAVYMLSNMQQNNLNAFTQSPNLSSGWVNRPHLIISPDVSYESINYSHLT